METTNTLNNEINAATSPSSVLWGNCSVGDQSSIRSCLRKLYNAGIEAEVHVFGRKAQFVLINGRTIQVGNWANAARTLRGAEAILAD